MPFPEMSPISSPISVGPERKEVVIIAAHMPRLDADPRVVERLQRRRALRKQPRLHLLRDLQLLRHAPLLLHPLARLAALRFDLPAHLIGAQQFEDVPVDVLKRRKSAAPQLGLRRLHKLHAAALPQLVRRVDILGDEGNVRGAADQPVILRSAPRSDQRQNRAAVRRSDRDPAAEFKSAVRQHAESEQPHIECKAAIVIAHVDVRFKDSEIRILRSGSAGGATRRLARLFTTRPLAGHVTLPEFPCQQSISHSRRIRVRIATAQAFRSSSDDLA